MELEIQDYVAIGITVVFVILDIILTVSNLRVRSKIEKLPIYSGGREPAEAMQQTARRNMWKVLGPQYVIAIVTACVWWFLDRDNTLLAGCVMAATVFPFATFMAYDEIAKETAKKNS